MRSKVEPLKKMVRTLRKHEDLIFNWFEAKGRISVGIVEGLNNKVKLTMRKSYGFRGVNVAQIALYHSLGNLPEPSANPQILLRRQNPLLLLCALASLCDLPILKALRGCPANRQ